MNEIELAIKECLKTNNVSCAFGTRQIKLETIEFYDYFRTRYEVELIQPDNEQKHVLISELYKYARCTYIGDNKFIFYIMQDK